MQSEKQIQQNKSSVLNIHPVGYQAKSSITTTFSWRDGDDDSDDIMCHCDDRCIIEGRCSWVDLSRWLSVILSISLSQFVLWEVLLCPFRYTNMPVEISVYRMYIFGSQFSGRLS